MLDNLLHNSAFHILRILVLAHGHDSLSCMVERLDQGGIRRMIFPATPYELLPLFHLFCRPHPICSSVV